MVIGRSNLYLSILCRKKNIYLQQEKALKAKSCANRDFTASQEHRLTPRIAAEWEVA